LSTCNNNCLGPNAVNIIGCGWGEVDTGSPKFTLELKKYGSNYVIRHTGNGLAIDLENGSTQVGTKLIYAPETGSSSQLWTFTPQGFIGAWEEKWQITNVASGLMMGYYGDVFRLVAQADTSNCARGWRLDSPKVCQECAPGYFLINNRCLTCIKNCAKCISLTKCDTCVAGYTKNPLNGLCEQACPANNYFRYTSQNCQACDSFKKNCGTCYDSAYTDLLETSFLLNIATGTYIDIPTQNINKLQLSVLNNPPVANHSTIHFLGNVASRLRVLHSEQISAIARQSRRIRCPKPSSAQNSKAWESMNSAGQILMQQVQAPSVASVKPLYRTFLASNRNPL